MSDNRTKSAASELGEATKPPGFEAALSALIATFAVLVGVSITDFLDPAKTHISGDLYWWVFVMMISLLLRFIVGSAIHLKYTYGNTPQCADEVGPPRSRAVFLFFKDGAFLVWFGVLGVGMSHSWDAAGFQGSFSEHPFIVHAEWFLAAAFLWSVADFASRACYLLCHQTQEWPAKPPWLFWGAIDLSQYVITWFCTTQGGGQINIVQSLSIIYVIYLFVDFYYTIHALHD